MSQDERDRAAKAINDYLNGEESPEGKRLFEQWYASVPDEEHPASRPADSTADTLWQRIDKQRHLADDTLAEGETVNRLNVPSRRQFRWVVAASLLLMSLFAGVWYWLLPRRQQPNQLTYIERTNTAGQRSVVRLPDGSTVQLNAASYLRYPARFTSNQRDIWLTGEAFFEVKPDPQKPFVVHAGGLRTTVLGTRFNVRAYPTDSRVDVAVVSGRVRVADAQANVLLTPNQLATYLTDKQQLTRTNVPDAATQTAWTTGRLVFEKQTVADIIGILERHYNVSISLKDRRLANQHLNAEFDNEPLVRVLDLLCTYLHTTYHRTGSAIVIGS